MPPSDYDVNDAGAGASPAPNPTDTLLALYKNVDVLLDSLKVSKSERKEIEKNLMEAIAADLLTRLGGQLTEEERGELAGVGAQQKGKEPDLGAIAGFFRGKFSQDELIQNLAASTESVLTEFTQALKR